MRKRTSNRSESAAALLGASALRRSSPGSSTIEWHALAWNAALAATGTSRVSRASSSPAGHSTTDALELKKCSYYSINRKCSHKNLFHAPSTPLCIYKHNLEPTAAGGNLRPKGFLEPVDASQAASQYTVSASHAQVFRLGQPRAPGNR